MIEIVNVVFKNNFELKQVPLAVNKRKLLMNVKF